MLRESTGTGRDHSQPPLLSSGLTDQPQATLLQSELGGDWREHIKNTYLEPLGVNDDSNEFGYSRFRLNGCWLCVYRILRLPWTAIVLIAGAIALICFFIVFIVNGPSSRAAQSPVVVNGTQVVSGSENLVTIQCETDVSKEECEKRARDRVAARDFQQAMTETHLFTTLIMFWLAATIFFVIKAVRIRKKFRYLESLPRTSIPVFSDLIPPSQQTSGEVVPGGAMNGGGGQGLLGTPGVSATQQHQVPLLHAQSQSTTTSSLQLHPASMTMPAVQNTPAPTTLTAANNAAVLQDEITSFMVSKVPVHQQMKRSVSLRRYVQFCAEPSGNRKPADSNWGWRGEYAGVHFPSTIKLAVHDYLEARVVAIDETLRIRKEQTVRDWLMMLRIKILPQETALDALADFYERARFSDESLDESTWYFRMHQAYEVSRKLEEVLMQRSSQVKTEPHDAQTPPTIETSKLGMSRQTAVFTPVTQEQSYMTAKQEDDSSQAESSSQAPDSHIRHDVPSSSSDARASSSSSHSLIGPAADDFGVLRLRPTAFSKDDDGFEDASADDISPRSEPAEGLARFPEKTSLTSADLADLKPLSFDELRSISATSPKGGGKSSYLRNARSGSL